MTVDTFRNLLAARPFVPFRVEMSSGNIYEVRHPEMAKLMKTDLMVYLSDADESLPSQFMVCSYLHITAVGPLAKTTAVA